MKVNSKIFRYTMGVTVFLFIFFSQTFLANALQCPEGAEQVFNVVGGQRRTIGCKCLPGRIQVNKKCPKVEDIKEVQSLRLLREQVEGIQTALRRMDKSAAVTQQQLEEWGERAEKTCKSAVARLKTLTIDLTIGAIQKRMGGLLGKVGKRIEGAEETLAKTKNPLSRMKIMASIKTLKGKQEKLMLGKLLITDQIERANNTYNTIQIGSADAKQGEKGMRTVYSIIQRIFNDPVAQEAWKVALELGEDFLPAVSLAESYVDSAYEITTGVYSWMRIAQFNRTTEQYLDAVDSLKGHMEDVMGKIKDIEKQYQ